MRAWPNILNTEKMMSDLDGLFEFADDDKMTGFRLKRVEVYNWGTFHDRIWELSLDGRNGLLTGDIGSGKSTLVDAVTTLLVPSNRVSYNKAAGAEHRERSLRSYVLGYYKSERSDGGYSAKPVALRERNSYSVILGVFENEGFNQTVTLAQVFWQKEAAGQPARFFIVADRELSIREHFSGFGNEIAMLKKRLRTLEHVEPPFDTFPSYGAAFRRRFGLKSEQALELFHQTVSLKSIGNLTGFVRENMLEEAFDTTERIDELIRHFDDLNRAHEAVVKARTQIERLKPLAGNLRNLNELEDEFETLVKCREGLSPWFANEKAVLLESRISKQQALIDKLELKSDGVAQNRDSMRGERDELKRAITESGGDRLEAMKNEALEREKEKGRKLKHFEDYSELCALLGFKKPRNTDVFVDNKTRAGERAVELKTRLDSLQNERTENGVELRGLKKDYDDLEREVESLKQRRSNISSSQISIRDRLCKTLNLPEHILPFAGELIAVKEEDTQWEGAIERVLHNFALSLLVPEQLYADVAEWVDSTDLRGRLVYYKVPDEQNRRPGQIAEDSLPAKVMVKTDSPYRDWLEAQLQTRFDYTCCEDLEYFRKVKKGLTRYGQIKGSAFRHEKDDRHNINDRSRYVLGWSNRAKLRVLEQQLRELESTILEIAEIITKINDENEKLDDEKQKLTRLGTYDDWEELDWKTAAKRIEYLEKEIAKIEGSSDRLRTLSESLDRVEVEIEAAEKEYLEIKQESAAMGAKRDNLCRLLEDARKTVDSSVKSISELDALRPVIEAELPGMKLTIENCDARERQIRERLQSRIDALNKRVKNLTEKVVSVMTEFRKDYPAETRDFDASIESGPDYIALLQQLQADDLPSFEARFKKQLNENTIREIAAFQARLNNEFHQIEERIALINKSMSAIEYNRGRYIKLETMQTIDSDIRTFRQELKSCTEGSLSDTETELYTEEKFIQVKAIVDRFRGREGLSDADRKWTTKVADVRNWFVFAASERWSEDDTEYEHYTDSGGKSGGQKEKLAYTILAASLAYQFGLEWGEVRSRSFRFVVIDEAFGRGSDESTRYGLELFRQLNLQFLLITPLQKINIIEPYVSTVGFVHNEDGMRSLLRSITIEQYRTEKAGQEKNDADES